MWCVIADLALGIQRLPSCFVDGNTEESVVKFWLRIGDLRQTCITFIIVPPPPGPRNHRMLSIRLMSHLITTTTNIP